MFLFRPLYYPPPVPPVYLDRWLRDDSPADFIPTFLSSTVPPAYLACVPPSLNWVPPTARLWLRHPGTFFASISTLLAASPSCAATLSRLYPNATRHGSEPLTWWTWATARSLPTDHPFVPHHAHNPWEGGNRERRAGREPPRFEKSQGPLATNAAGFVAIHPHPSLIC